MLTGSGKGERIPGVMQVPWLRGQTLKKLMIVAAMLAMALAVAIPAFAQQESGDAESAGATVTAGDLANQCVQVANNVNSGNVDQEAAIANIQTNLGALADLEQAIATNVEDNVVAVVVQPNEQVAVVAQDVEQTNVQTNENEINQAGIEQVNNAQLTCEQAIAQVKK